VGVTGLHFFKEKQMVDVEVTPNDMAAAQAAQMWVESMPDEIVPEHSELIHLLIKAGGKPKHLFRAVERVGRKVASTASTDFPMTTEDISRYVFAVARSEAAGVRHVRPSSSNRIPPPR
jgi:hypothetical protein